MKSKGLTCIIAMTLLAVAIPVSLTAQNTAKRHHHHRYHHYQLIDPGNLGGPQSFFETNPPESIINARGGAVATIDTSTPDPFPSNCFIDCFVSDAVVWQRGVLTDLGALVAGYSSIAESINSRSEVVGVSENGQIDPLTGNYEAVAVLWKDGSVNLGTLGGNQSVANAINDRGQVVGAALNASPDPFANSPVPSCDIPFSFSWCFLFVPAATESHAFRWTEARGMQDLGTLGGPDSSASFVNQSGQIAGVSFTSFTPNPLTGVPTLDPFLWESGKMVDIGTLGGTWGVPHWMNNRGQVVGASNVAGDQNAHAFVWDGHHNPPLTDLGTFGGSNSNAAAINDKGEIVGGADLAGNQESHAFLWKNGAMTDLGTVAGDACSLAYSINSQGQIVGWARAGGCGDGDHAFLWEDGGPIVDLQSLVQLGSGLTLYMATFINDQGEIAALASLSDGNQRAVVLIPCDENHPGVEGCDYNLVEATAAARVQAPQVARTPSGALRSGITSASWGRLRTRTARR
jgi:probable HAF family extracellular repeat protein